MSVIAPGSEAPAIPGTEFGDEPKLVFLYKVTCPVCKLAAPVVERVERAAPGRLVGVGQDPADQLQDFSAEYSMTFPSVPDLPPYDLSEAFGIEVVPTLVLVNRGRVDDVVESWDRERYNRVAARLADLAGLSPFSVSDPGDGLPPFRPG